MGAATPETSEPREERRSLEGQVIGGRFRIRRLIGRGGMGEVHEAEHIELARRVAIKIMHGRVAQNRSSVTRIRREARSLASLEHPHIVQVLDAGEHEGTPFLVMELLEGEDLRTRIDRVGPLPAGEAIAIATQILAGLGAVHASGIVHRDVKPENVFLTAQEDGAPFVKLLDFGVSKLMEIDSAAGNLTESGTIVGSPAFMAPEQAVGSSGIDARTDLYSVGAVLYTMLAGKPPFSASNIPAVLLAIVEGRHRPLGEVRPGLPPGLCDLVERALSKERGKRFRNAADFAEALQPYVPTGMAMPSVPSRLPIRRLALGGAVALALAALALSGAFSSGESHERRPNRSPRSTTIQRPQAPLSSRPAEPPPRHVKRAILRVKLRPPRIAEQATITLDGRRVVAGEAVVDVSMEPRVLRVRAPGFQARELTLVVSEDKSLEVSLDRERRGAKGGGGAYRGRLGISPEFPQ